MQITKPIRRLANRIEILQSFSPHSIPGKSHQMPSRNRELSASSSPKLRRKRNPGGGMGKKQPCVYVAHSHISQDESLLANAEQAGQNAGRK